MKMIRFLACGMLVGLALGVVGCGAGVTTTATPAVSGLGVVNVSGLSPNSARIGQTITVTITGSNFQTGATVTSDPGIDVSNVTVSSPVKITARFVINENASLGVKRIIVTNPNGFSSGSLDVFTITQ